MVNAPEMNDPLRQHKRGIDSRKEEGKDEKNILSGRLIAELIVLSVAPALAKFP